MIKHGTVREWTLVSLVGAMLCGVCVSPSAQDAGSAVQFDGVDDLFEVPNVGLDFPDSNVTIEFWQRADDVRDQVTFLLAPDDPFNRVLFSSDTTSGFTFWGYGNDTIAQSTPVGLTGAWHHWALVAGPTDGGYSIFLDGTRLIHVDGTEMFTSRAGAFHIGGNTNGGNFFRGEIDEFRIWSVARADWEIRAGMNCRLTGAESNLWAYWRFDENTGTNVADLSGHGRNGYLINTPAWVASGATLAAGSGLVVTNTADAGPGSLRQAICYAAANPGPDTITFDAAVAGAVIKLATPLVVSDTNALVLNGAGLGAGVVVNGEGTTRVFRVQPGARLALHSLTVSNGLAASGAGILNEGTLALTNCAFVENDAFAALAPASGGAIENLGGSLTAVQCTFQGNLASGTDAAGGAINVNGGTVALRHCTFAGNSVVAGGTASGGALAVSGGATVTLTHTIAAGNTAAFGPDVYAPSTNAVTSGGFNLIGIGSSASGLTNGVGGNLVGSVATPVDPLLDTIQDNGGDTPTMLPLLGSPALNAGNAAFSAPPSTDQRGLARVSAGRIDLGAVEFQALAVTGPASLTNCLGLSAEFTASVTAGDEPITFQWSKNGSAIAGATNRVYSIAVTTGADTGTYCVVASYPVSSVTNCATLVVLTNLLVTNLADDGPGSLRQALCIASNNPGPDTITFHPSLSGQVIRLTNADFVITDTTGPLLISAASLPGGLAISGEGARRAFRVQPGTTLALDSLTISNGWASSVFPGPDNGGGAIHNQGTLLLTNCTFAYNRAEAAGGGDTVVGGAVESYLGTVRVWQCTFYGNTLIGAFSYGSAIDICGGNASIHHSTFTGNAGLDFINPGQVGTLSGGVAIFGGTLTLGHSIISSNAGLSRPDLYANEFAGGFLVSAGYNLIGDLAGTPGLTNGVNGDIAGSSGAPAFPLLAPLANNGGHTPTCLPLTGSPVIGAGNSAIAGAPATDQRGVTRVAGGVIDVGAVESRPPSATALTPLTRCLGQNASFSTTATSPDGPVTFQWYKDGSALMNETNSSLALTSLTLTDAAAYCVVVTGPCCTVTNCATLTVSVSPVVALTPVLVVPGESASFTATVTAGDGPFTYQWTKDGSALVGATDNVFTIVSTAPTDAGMYCVIVTGPCGNATNCATLSFDPDLSTFVSTSDDSGTGSLRRALLNAARRPGADVITFSTNLAGDLLRPGSQFVVDDSSGPVTITAEGLDRGLLITGESMTRLFLVRSNSSLTLVNLSVAEGRAPSGLPADGGGGGAVFNAGTLVISNCTLADNFVIGAGQVSGGAIENFGGTLAIFSSTFYANQLYGNGDSGTWGGAIDLVGGSALISHCTFAENAFRNGTGTGSAISSRAGAVVLLDHTIVAGNATNTVPELAEMGGGSIASAGFNLVRQGGSGWGGAVASDFTGTTNAPLNPRLDPLRDNGGTTFTCLPLAGSPALDAGNPAYRGMPAADQRGYARVTGGRIDIGAVESCLLAYYSFDNSTAVDEIGSSTAAFSGLGGPSWVSDRSAVPNSAAQFVSTQQRTYRLQTTFRPGNSASALGLQSRFTVSAWVRPGALGGDRVIVGNNVSGAGALHLGLRGNRAWFGIGTNGFLGRQIIASNVWTHLVWTYDRASGQRAMYVNAFHDGSSIGDTNVVGDSDLLIGSSTSVANGWFNGDMDDLAVFCEALTPHQVVLLTAGNRPSANLVTEPPSDLVANDCVWSVREIFHHSTRPVDLSAAEFLAYTPLFGTATNYQSAVINRRDPDTASGASGFFADDEPFAINNCTPSGLLNRDDNDFVLVARTSIRIAETDDYTFGFATADGGRLRIYGASFTNSTRLPVNTPASPAHYGDVIRDSGAFGSTGALGVAHLTPGDYEVEFLTWESTGTAHAEVFAARGAKTNVDASFQLLGGRSLCPVELTGAITPSLVVITNGAPARTVRFSVTAAGFNATYQWLFNGAPANAGNVSGADTGILTIANAVPANVGVYSVVVSNAAGVKTFGPAILAWQTNASPHNAKPVVKITSPSAASLRVTASNSVILAGTATDKNGLLGVFIDDGSGLFLPATGTATWSRRMPLAVGSNLFRVVAVDRAGNRSVAVTRSVFYVVTNMLAFATSGPGTVAPPRGPFEVGRNYVVKATPGAGFIFSHWSGGASSFANPLTFTSRSNATITAHFITSPFTARKGAYNGLFYEKGTVRHDQAGFFTAAVTDKGVFTASLLIGTKKFPFTGQFFADGTATNRVALTRSNTVTIRLQLRLDGSDMIDGNVTDGIWTAPLAADRQTFDARVNRATNYLGNYNLAVGRTDPQTMLPRTEAHGSASVDAAGLTTFKGTLADGGPLAQKVPLSKNGDWPFYQSLAAGKGSLLGWLTVVSNTPFNSVTGAVSWIKPASTKDKFNQGGITNVLEVIGSAYRPTTNRSALNLTIGGIVYSEGNLAGTFGHFITLQSNNTVTTTNSTRLTITPGTGQFRGTVTEPGRPRTISFSGVLLPRQNIGVGFFPGTNRVGYVFLGEDP